MGAGLPADSRRAQSGPVPCSGAERRGKALDEVSAAIPGDGVAGNEGITGRHAPFPADPVDAVVRCSFRGQFQGINEFKYK
jgi:hypothetical protein